MMDAGCETRGVGRSREAVGGNEDDTATEATLYNRHSRSSTTTTSHAQVAMHPTSQCLTQTATHPASTLVIVSSDLTLTGI